MLLVRLKKAILHIYYHLSHVTRPGESFQERAQSSVYTRYDTLGYRVPTHVGYKLWDTRVPT